MHDRLGCRWQVNVFASPRLRWRLAFPPTRESDFGKQLCHFAREAGDDVLAGEGIVLVQLGDAAILAMNNHDFVGGIDDPQPRPGRRAEIYSPDAMRRRTRR